MTDGRGDVPLSFQREELDRRVDRMIRVGVVEAVDHAQARVRVRVDGALSGWLPVTQARSGQVRSWSPLSVGEQVCVFAPSGETVGGFVLGTLPRDAFPPAGNTGDTYRTVWADGTTQEYDAATKTMTTTVGQTVVKQQEDKIELSLGGVSFLLSASGITIKGNVTVQGDVTADGISLKTHKHGGVQAGAAQTGVPVA